MKANEISGVVLAGGKNKRMGLKKAELELGGRTLLELQVQKLRDLGIEDIMVSGYDKAIDGTRAVADIYPGKGPISGVHAALKAAEKPACLVISVDTPLVPADVLKALIEAHEGEATVLAHGDLIEPLLAVYDSGLHERAETLLLSDSWSMRRMSSNPAVKKIEYTGDMDLLLNCNTPEDFEKAKSLWR